MTSKSIRMQLQKIWRGHLLVDRGKCCPFYWMLYSWEILFITNIHSRYKNGTVDGKVWGPWPGSGPHFLETIASPRWEDWNYKYLTSNRFQYLGNGTTQREVEGGDLSWFIK